MYLLIVVLISNFVALIDAESITQAAEKRCPPGQVWAAGKCRHTGLIPKDQIIIRYEDI